MKGVRKVQKAVEFLNKASIKLEKAVGDCEESLLAIDSEIGSLQVKRLEVVEASNRGAWILKKFQDLLS